MARTPAFQSIRRLLRRAIAARPLPGGFDQLQESLDRPGRAALVSRRDWLGASSAMALSTIAGIRCGGGASRKPLPQPSPNRDNPTVVVVGAGLAGLHCTYRLAQAGVDVALYEASSRTGGRVHSTRVGAFEGAQVAELGGELIDRDHVVMRRLAAEFDLQLDNLPGSLPRGIPYGYRFYFEGRWIQERELIEAFSPIVGKLDTINRTLAETGLARGLEALFRARLEIDRRYESLDALLSEAGISDLGRKILRYSYVAEFGRELDEQSVFNLLDMFPCDATSGCVPAVADDKLDLFAGSNEIMRFHDGNEAITRAIAGVVADRVTFGARLLKIARSGAQYELSFGKRAGATQAVRAPYLVLALPFSLLREVELGAGVIAKDNWEIIRQIGYGTNSKLIGQFANRNAWRNVKSDGTLVTDLRSDNDRELHNIWDTSRGQDSPYGLLTNFVGGRAGLEIAQGASNAQWKSMLPRLEAPFPSVRQAYLDGSARRMVWPTQPFAKGSYRCALAGQIGLADRTPTAEADGTLQYCGEHISVWAQGYMEGAAETGARSAAAILVTMAKVVPPLLAAIIHLTQRRSLAHRRARPARFARTPQGQVDSVEAEAAEYTAAR